MNNTDSQLGTEPILPLLFRLALPAMFSMFINALYNLVDAIFVGQAAGPNAIAALAIAFPVQQIILALALMIGQGTASIVSRALGAGDRRRAAEAAGTAFMAALLSTGVLSLISIRYLEHVLILFGATSEIISYGRDYLGIIMLSAPLLAVTIVANNILRAEGKPTIAMNILLIGALLNIALDPILIFVLDMGIRGAAVATAVSQGVAFLYVFSFFVQGRSGLALQWKDLLLQNVFVRESALLGLPIFIRQGANSVIATLINNLLAVYGTAISIAVYGTINRLLIFMLMPMFGMLQAFQPVAGYNFGAGQMKRVEDTVKITLLSLVIYGTGAAALMMVFPGALFRLFTNDMKMIQEGVPALRLIVSMIPFIGVQIIGATFFQSIGHARPAVVLGLLRQVFLLIPLVIVLPRLLGVMGIWVAFPISDLTATVVTALVLYRSLQNIIGPRQITVPMAE